MRTQLTAALACVAFATSAGAEEFVVGQKNKAFTVGKLEVVVGDTVSFRNDDPFFHNIFSLSEAQSFDLGSFPKGQSRRVTFDKPGEVDIECAIHPEMKLRIDVRPKGEKPGHTPARR